MMPEWRTKWESRREKVLIRSFALHDVVNLQWNFDRANACTRDMELVRLKSDETYTNSTVDPSPYFATKFCPSSNSPEIFAAADEYGNLSLHNVRAVKKEILSVRALNNAIFGISWMPDGTKILACCGDHTARLYDIGQNITEISKFVGHKKSVKTADFMPEDPSIFATGSRDGSILIYDTRSSSNLDVLTVRYDQVINCAVGLPARFSISKVSVENASSVTALAFRDRNNLLCCGSFDSLVRVWDMRVTYCTWKVSRPKSFKKSRKSGYTDLKLSPDRNRLYASSFNGPIFGFNLNSDNEAPVAEFTGHDAGSFYVKTSVSPDGEYLASGSLDRAVHIWSTNRADLEPESRKPMIRLSGHNAEVTAVDMACIPRIAVVSGGDDGIIRSWLPRMTLVDEEEKSRDLNTICAELIIRERRPKHADYQSPKKSGQCTPKKSPRTLTPPRRATRSSEVIYFSRKRKLPFSPNKDERLSPKKTLESPTLNLPNYVLDGTGPFHSCTRARQKENLNWLTEIRRKSVEKRSSVEKERKKMRRRSKNSTSRSLLEYYQKSGKAGDDATKQQERN